MGSLMGHVTFLGLLRRGNFCRSSAVSTCSLASLNHRREHLWISARAELEAFVGVMILIESDWARPWLSGVLVSDASLSVFGAAKSFWTPSDVAAVGRIPK